MILLGDFNINDSYLMLHVVLSGDFYYRQEIPFLKTVFYEFQKNLEFFWHYVF